MAGPSGSEGALKTEFDGSLGKLGPLRERIERTDRLIEHGRGLFGRIWEKIGIVDRIN